MTSLEKAALLHGVTREAKLGESYRLPVILNLQDALIVIANMQLALRHPRVKVSPSGRIAQGIIDQVIERIRQDGYIAHARLMELGNNPEHDEL